MAGEKVAISSNMTFVSHFQNENIHFIRQRAKLVHMYVHWLVHTDVIHVLSN